MSYASAKIVQVALSKVGSQLWRYDVVKDEFGKDTNKCNKFVYDVIKEAGVGAPTVSMYWFFSRPPTAAEWADPASAILHWKAVDEPQPGDVVAEKHAYTNATGHCGIVVGTNQSVSASSFVNGVIVQNDWGFRADNSPTFRRYTP